MRKLLGSSFSELTSAIFALRTWFNAELVVMLPTPRAYALKLPATILSRTQHFRFKKISNKDVVHHLSHILNEEGIEFESECLDIISRSGQGSLRDTLTLLDQAIIFSKGKITRSCVVDMLGLIDPSFMEEVFDIVLNKKDINDVIHKLEEYEASE